MKNNILFGVSVFTLSLVALFMLTAFIIMIYPFNDVSIQKLTPLKASYARGEVLEKSLMICKRSDIPIKIVLEMEDGDVIPLTSKESLAPAGCHEYIISEEIPNTTKLEEHVLIVTISYNKWFRTISQRFKSDKFLVTNNVLK